jgi:mannose-6-phosphate isomerase-like protein (cupin superfamily)
MDPVARLAREAAGLLGAMGEREIAGALATRTCRAAMRTAGPVPAPLSAAARARDALPLARTALAAAPFLAWTGSRLAWAGRETGRAAFADIAGPEGPLACPADRAGLFLLWPDAFYPLHDHAAAEVYAVLSGTALWMRGPRARAATHPPGSRIAHAPHEPHAIRTGAAPMLALWVWSGDIRPETYRMAPPGASRLGPLEA